MRARIVLAFVLCATACGQASPASSVVSPASPRATLAAASPPYAVMQRLAGPGHPYVVQLVAKDGVAGPFVTATARDPKTYYFPPGVCAPATSPCQTSEIAAFNLPEVSISSSRVYFLDGETQVKSLAVNGTVQNVMNIDAPDNSQVVFAVSPDDARIAVAIITLATDNEPAPFTDTIYVLALGKGAPGAVAVYSSTTRPEWPVAWHHGELVLGVGPSDIASYNTAYGAIGYEMVDPDTGAQLATLDCAAGLLTAAGSACVSGFCSSGSGCGPGTIGRQAYDGVKTMFALPSGPPPKILTALAQTDELSPDGSAVAVTALPSAPGRLQNDTLLVHDGAWSILTGEGAPIGWVDDTHLMVAAAFQAFIVDTTDPLSVASVSGDAMPRLGFPTLAGLLPTTLT